MDLCGERRTDGGDCRIAERDDFPHGTRRVRRRLLFPAVSFDVASDLLQRDGMRANLADRRLARAGRADQA